MRCILETPSKRYRAEFLAAVARSRSLHRGKVTPPRTAATFDAYLERLRKPAHIGYWVRTGDGELAGVISASEIVRGVFQSAYLGYYAFSPHNGQGHMNCGLRAVLGDCSECIGCIASKRTFSLVMPPRGGWFAASDSGWKAFHRGT